MLRSSRSSLIDCSNSDWREETKKLEISDEEGREGGKGGESRAHLLLERVGVVESKQHLSVVLVGEVSVEKSSLGVTDVEVTRGLRSWKERRRREEVVSLRGSRRGRRGLKTYGIE